MKFKRKSIRSNHRDLSNTKKKFLSTLFKHFSWHVEKVQLPRRNVSTSIRIEDLENEFMCVLEKINERISKNSIERTTNEDQRIFYANQRLIITRSIDDFTRVSRKRYLHTSFSSPFVYRRLLKPTAKRSNQSDLSLTISTHDAAIIDFEHQSLGKSSSLPLPITTTHSSIENTSLQSAHLIHRCFYENQNAISVQSCLSEIGVDQSISSDDENVERSLLKHDKDYLRHRWNFFDIWNSTKARLPPVLNHIWRKHLGRTGSKEYLLECDQTLSTNNNNHLTNSIQEQRYVEQERPIDEHIGLALFALLVFPPIGMIAFILSIWSVCGQQDRHLSRKFGNAVYWISLLAITFAFLLLFTLFLYFTYRYLTHPFINHSN